MNFIEVEKRNERLMGKLFGIWKSSVRETHLFLSAPEIEKIAVSIPEALKSVPILITAVNDTGEPCAFMGIGEERLEMLFVASEERGKGVGKRLLGYGIENFSVKEVYVNEQNPQAKGFYEKMGFEVRGRTDTDDRGNPYPLLYMILP